MQRVTGIGGIFFKARDAVALRSWYQTYLGLDVQPWGGATVGGTDDAGRPVPSSTLWRISGDEAEDFGPGQPSFLINYRVADLKGLLATLRSEGCTVLDETDDSEYGQFGWVIDPEGNKVELWQPPEGQ
jgi:hypothetical protein